MAGHLVVYLFIVPEAGQVPGMTVQSHGDSVLIGQECKPHPGVKEGSHPGS